MKSIILDPEDEYLRPSLFWRSNKYPGLTHEGKQKYLQHVLLAVPEGMYVDHINGNKSDYRKSNLRLCSKSQNNCNVGVRLDSVTGFKGVYWNSTKKRFQASIQIAGKRRYLGTFSDPKIAALAYNEAALKYHGEFAFLNEVN